MKVVIENRIPYVHGVIEQPGVDAVYLPAGEITASSVADADALLVRTRTECCERLLGGSRCRFVGTATIGTDHIDLDYCRNAGINVVNAPGCNAPAVAQYVLATIGVWAQRREMDVSQLTLGVVGTGHVGSIVARFARQCGIKVLVCDPPKALAGEYFDDCIAEIGYVDMPTIAANAHVITFHTPLTHTGDHPTAHLCGREFLSSLKHTGLIINSARGLIVDTAALLDYLSNHPEVDVAIDCWEDEPHLSDALLERSFVATPHIAGYSAQGKIRGTSMVLDALAKHFGININPIVPESCYPLRGASSVNIDKILNSYNPLNDTRNLKACPAHFEQLRNNYALRDEVKE